MSNSVTEDFPRLVPFGARRDYLMWANNVKDYLFMNNLYDTIVPGTECSDQQKAQALVYMRRHLNEDFRSEYNLEFDPRVQWQSLEHHFDRMKATELPQAKAEWERLYFSDFGSVTAYDSALQRIVTQLKICDQEVTDEEMIEKTLSTFPPSQLMLHRQLRMANFATYSKLIIMLLLEEKDNPDLLKKHDANPTTRGGFQEKTTESEAKIELSGHHFPKPGTSYDGYADRNDNVIMLFQV